MVRERGIAHLLLIVLVVGVVGFALVFYFFFQKGSFPYKSVGSGTFKTPPSSLLQEKYENPFDEKTQYQNPFSEYSNPFDNLE